MSQNQPSVLIPSASTNPGVPSRTIAPWISRIAFILLLSACALAGAQPPARNANAMQPRIGILIPNHPQDSPFPVAYFADPTNAQALLRGMDWR